MLTIRNNATSKAKARAAQTSRAGSSLDSGTKMDREFAGLSA